MTQVNMPLQLATPAIISGKIASKVMLDLTVYLTGPSEHELDYLIDLYERICPSDRLVRYKISELEYWSSIASPDLTASGRDAAAVGIRRPYLQPVRQRIQDGRAFEIQFWDGRSINEPDGSWSFNCRRMHHRSTGLHAFVRILMPLNADLDILRIAATEIADNIEFFSGHGGLVFVYDPWVKEAAFNTIYAQARRYWGVDVEDLNETLLLMREAIKGINWVTLLGRELVYAVNIEEILDQLEIIADVTVEQCQHGSVVFAGSEPVVGDQHRPDRSLDSYYAIADVLKPLFLTQHPDFSGERFIQSGNTTSWIRRFIDPDGWR